MLNKRGGSGQVSQLMGSEMPVLFEGDDKNISFPGEREKTTKADPFLTASGDLRPEKKGSAQGVVL